MSVVIPIKNEEVTIAGLAAEIDQVFSQVDYRWEVVWVDDGSTDVSAAIVRGLGGHHRLVSLTKNFGQSAAFIAGFHSARGEWVGTLDGDGQNDPADLPRQLAHALDKGVDLCNGIRAKRNDSIVRKLSSKIGNGFRAWITGEREVKDVGCSTRVVRRVAVLRLPCFHGMHRFLPTLVKMQGYTMDQIPVNHRQRAGGTSKYGVWNRMWSGMRDCFGVRWLQSRWRTWDIANDSHAE